LYTAGRGIRAVKNERARNFASSLFQAAVVNNKEVYVGIQTWLAHDLIDDELIPF
jgi:hypothetical protein